MISHFNVENERVRERERELLYNILEGKRPESRRSPSPMEIRLQRNHRRVAGLSGRNKITDRQANALMKRGVL
ncbi:hypothetical protein EVAR_18056_1 [Eumeta japonica]|uniref:Uncharacterized protein n=1 Tax=Eumeta variegata TaxID=151549 RepID=A0A4C1XV04_EUMVA|nr:hypothetical protein EVAR_18056_1 [Eumeta japonica]